MKKSVKKLCFLCLLICNTICVGFSQDRSSELIKLAEHFMSIDHHRAANKMFLKAYFLDRTNDHTELPLQISESFYLLNDFENASKYINTYIRQSSIPLHKQMDAKYFKLRMLYEQKRYKETLASLFQFKQDQIDYDRDKYHYYLALSYSLDNNYKNSQEAIEQLSYYHLLPKEEINYIFKRLIKNDQRWNYKYTLLSMFVPGLGQFAYGDYADALNSFIINAGFATLFIYIQQTLSLTDAVLSVAPWFGRYYVGGLNNTSIGSKKHQNTITDKYIVQLIQVLSKYKPLQ